MFTILVPIDFSTASLNATNYAAQMAQAMGANLLLFHAYMLPTPVSEVPYVMVTADQLQKENEGILKKEADRIFGEYGVQAEWLVRIGIPSTEIKVITEERSISLITMGMKGQNGLEKIIGSTTTNTIQKVQTPLLVIPEHCRFKQPSHITYATDFSYETPETTYRSLTEICNRFNAKLHILHISKEEEMLSPDAISGKVKLGLIFEKMPHDFHEVAESNVQTGINSFVETHNSDLLVMVAHNHSFFERIFSKSQTKTMAFETNVPLLVLKG